MSGGAVGGVKKGLGGLDEGGVVVVGAAGGGGSGVVVGLSVGGMGKEKDILCRRCAVCVDALCCNGGMRRTLCATAAETVKPSKGIWD